MQNLSYRHKNTGWEHAGCDGTPKCVAVPGAAACLCVAWCAWLFQPAQRQEVCRLSRENTRLLIKNFNAFTPPHTHTLPSCLSHGSSRAGKAASVPASVGREEQKRPFSDAVLLHLELNVHSAQQEGEGGGRCRSVRSALLTQRKLRSIYLSGFYQKYNKEGRSLCRCPTRFWYQGNYCKHAHGSSETRRCNSCRKNTLKEERVGSLQRLFAVILFQYTKNRGLNQTSLIFFKIQTSGSITVLKVCSNCGITPELCCFYPSLCGLHAQ